MFKSLKRYFNISLYSYNHVQTNIFSRSSEAFTSECLEIHNEMSTGQEY